VDKSAKIYIAGHRGLAGSAFVRRLARGGYTNLVMRTHAELDLTDARATAAFFEAEKPDYVLLAAAKVGGILANDTYPADFIRENLAIQTNVIHQAYTHGVKRLLFLGSSCIYPRDCAQPMREDSLLTGPLEPTNRAYALAKIAGVEMCWSYNRQYGTHFVAAMPTNLYGPGDNYNLETSHVLPALVRKMHEAKAAGRKEMEIWGSGKPLREFMHSDDMADACVHLLELPEAEFAKLTRSKTEAPLLNVGTGIDQTILELAEMIRKTVGFDGRFVFDASKPDGTPRKLLDVSRLRATGWRPHFTLETGLADAYRDFLENHAK
jgi:GDP-L-fucose synthase